MTDEIHVTRRGTTGAEPDPNLAREQIERTRARMSETIDEIEDVLLRKKERIQDRLDLMAPVRDRPFPSLGTAFGAGLLIGFLTGGDDEPPSRPLHSDPDERADLWESRARRLLRIAQEQEEQIESLTGTTNRIRREDWDADGEVEERGPLHDLGENIAERLSGFISHAVGQMNQPRTDSQGA